MATASTVALPRIAESTYPLDLQQEAPALPDGLPKQLESDLCWTGADFVDEAAYVCRLTPVQLSEIDEALVHFKGGFGLPMSWRGAIRLCLHSVPCSLGA
jgi:hypothetical protein